MKSHKKLIGRCLCEKISYEITGDLGPIFNCHCSKCRRWHGSAFRTRAAIETKNFNWLTGEELVSGYTYADGNITKTFCANCGSSLITKFKDRDYIGLPIGGLELGPGNKPIANIFVGSKAPWYEITDGLPQYDEWPPGASDVVRSAKS